MIIYQIEIFWNFDSFPGRQILKIWEIFGIFRTEKILEFLKLEDQQFSRIFQFEKQKFGSENWQNLELFIHLKIR